MTPIFEALGMVGVGLSVVGYFPQVRHLLKEQCSAGFSSRAWALWLASSLMVGALAIYRKDYVFISLVASSLFSSAAILVIARRYRGLACSTHRPVSLSPYKRDRQSSNTNTKEMSLYDGPTTHIGN